MKFVAHKNKFITSIAYFSQVKKKDRFSLGNIPWMAANNHNSTYSGWSKWSQESDSALFLTVVSLPENY